MQKKLYLEFEDMKYNPIAILLLPLFVLVFGCEHTETETIKRPRDPWAIRSVLDKHPRMLTLALHKDGYAAYDTESCALYKLWKGGIIMDGAAFTGIKEVQPRSWGLPYYQDSLHTDSWIARKDKKDMPVQAQFKGYLIENNQIILNYVFTLPDGQLIRISEQPEFRTDYQGNPEFTRSFVCSKLPEGVSLRLEPSDGRIIELNQGKSFLPIRYEALPAIGPPPLTQKANRGDLWLSRSGCNTCHEQEENTVGPGYLQIARQYERNKQNVDRLSQKVKQGGSGIWGQAAMIPHPQLDMADISYMVNYILSLSNEKKPAKRAVQKVTEEAFEQPKPGFGAALTALHPSYDLSTIRPQGFKPKVGAMDFTPDGKLLLTTWDSVGGVYVLEGVETGDTNNISITRMAAGLAEPLGIKVVDDEIFVLQKQELTQLIDHDGDGITNEYKTICNGFGVTDDFHEFSYGLVYKDGYFYANLGIAMRLMKHEQQHPDRGKTIRISRNGEYETLNSGLRQPNGISVGIDGEIFITENQGNWVPACQLIHVQEGAFHGCRWVFEGLNTKKAITPPVVWMPQDEIGNSPGQPLIMQDGPYKGQILIPEVTNGGIKRAFVEKINGVYQGALFRFTQGLEAGINRMVWGPDGSLYVGGVGMSGGWSWKEKQYGLQKLDLQ